MKKLIVTFFLVFGSCHVFAQQYLIDSLMHQLARAKYDTSRVLFMAELCHAYRSSNPDSSRWYGQQALSLAQIINFPKGKVRATTHLGRVLFDAGNLPKALQMQYKALQIAEDNGLIAETAYPLNRIGTVFNVLGDLPKAIYFRQRALKVFVANNEIEIANTVMNNLINSYTSINKLDSALFYIRQVEKNNIRLRERGSEVFNYVSLGRFYDKKNNYPLALDYYKKALQITVRNQDLRNGIVVKNDIGRLFQRINKPDSSIFYAKEALTESQSLSYRQGILESTNLLSELYQSIDVKESFRYYKMAVSVKDSLFGAGNMQAIRQMINDEQERQKEIEAEKIAYQNQLKQYALLVGLGVALLIAFVLYRNNQKEKHAKKLLQEQKDKVESTLTKLKSTQAQLIQKEKLASLGELAAGIAHEIQNPLNFVNNFSELSVELAKELQEEVEKSPLTPDGGIIIAKKDKEYIDGIIDDLSQNQAKINHHGKRASNIVSGMLEHSKATTGERALTDMNKLADEYLRLSYHGIRAKDSKFNSDYKTDFDENLPKIEVIPQDIGRVLLNLINNAFYAVHQRNHSVETGHALSLQNDLSLSAQTIYQPTVSISTKQAHNQIIISVSDNGAGIPENIKEKIFQPFFTTKPTGQGTGLGLSLAYDIITKGHGGTIEVDSVEGQGTTFIVKLPLQV